MLGHLQPTAAVFAGLMHGGDAMTGLRAEGIYQCSVQRHIGDEHSGHGAAHVVLGDKGFQHGLLQLLLGTEWMGDIVLHAGFFHQLAGIFQLGGKVRLVAQMPAAAHHGEIDAGFAA